MIKTPSFLLLDIPLCRREPTRNLFYSRGSATPASLLTKTTSLSSETWMSYWQSKNMLVILPVQLVCNLLTKTKLLTLKKLKRKNLKQRIKKKHKNQFLMKMEMRFHRMVELQLKREIMQNLLNNLEWRITSGPLLTKNHRIYLNFL